MELSVLLVVKCDPATAGGSYKIERAGKGVFRADATPWCRKAANVHCRIARRPQVSEVRVSIQAIMAGLTLLQ